VKAAIGAVRMRMKDAVEVREVDRIAVADDQAVNQSMPGRLYPRVDKVGDEARLKDFAITAALQVLVVEFGAEFADPVP
jgi:hypothetical protein